MPGSFCKWRAKLLTIKHRQIVYFAEKVFGISDPQQSSNLRGQEFESLRARQ